METQQGSTGMTWESCIYARYAGKSSTNQFQLDGVSLGDWVHFQGKQLCHFDFCLPSQWGSTLQGKNLIHMDQILFFKSIPHFGQLLS